jgi:hypothetical protein
MLARGALGVAEETGMSVAKKRRAHGGENAEVVSIQREARAAVVVEAELEGLRTARVLSIGAGDALELELRGQRMNARRDAAVHPEVIVSALARSEVVLVEISGGEAWVVGALRTQPALGSDRVDDVDLRAARIRLAAERVEIEGEEVSLSSKTARVVLRAAGEIESFADRIVSRASGVHKIVGRMLRLN